MRSGGSWTQRVRAGNTCLASAVLLTLLVAFSALSSYFSLSAQHAKHAHPAEDHSVSIRVQMRTALAAAPSAAIVGSNQSQATSNQTSDKPTLRQYASVHCANFTRAYSRLLDSHMSAWRNASAKLDAAADCELNKTPHLFIQNNKLFLDRRAVPLCQQSTSLLLQHLQHLQIKVQLPDLALSLNADVMTAPQLSFCARQDQAELGFPQFLKDQTVLSEVRELGQAHKQVSLLSNMTPKTPDDPSAQLLNATVIDFSKACDNLASKLSSGTAVFRTGHGEFQWYHELLKPFIHFVPVWANQTHNNLPDMLSWASNNKYAVSVISQQAQDFTRFYLSHTGRECFAFQVLFRLNLLGYGNFSLPESAIDISDCSSLHKCPQLFTQSD